MDKTQQRQMARGKAFNAIMRIYHPKAKPKYNRNMWNEGFVEQRDDMVHAIVKEYLRDLDKINKKNNEQT